MMKILRFYNLQLFFFCLLILNNNSRGPLGRSVKRNLLDIYQNCEYDSLYNLTALGERYAI